MTPTSQILEIADRLKEIAKEQPAAKLDALENAANDAGKAWSGSWLGYHSRVYYENLRPIPPGARFSKEWGFKELYATEGTHGAWAEFDFDGLVTDIKRTGGTSDMTTMRKKAKTVKLTFEDAQSELLSILTPIGKEHVTDVFLTELIDKIKGEKIYSSNDYIKMFRPNGQQMSRDMIAIHAGFETPPHFAVLAQVLEIRNAFISCENISKFARRSASHLENISKKKAESERVGTKRL